MDMLASFHACTSDMEFDVHGHVWVRGEMMWEDWSPYTVSLELGL
jgi:hypothetical protein